jgi:hypothetical protein
LGCALRKCLRRVSRVLKCLRHPTMEQRKRDTGVSVGSAIGVREGVLADGGGVAAGSVEARAAGGQ